MADRTTVKRPLSWPVVRIVFICSPALETVISPACPTTMVSHPCDQHRLEGTAGGTCRSFRVFMTNPTTCGNNGVRNLVTLDLIIPSWYEILWQSLANWSLPAKRELMMMDELCKPSPTCCEFCVVFTPSQLSSLPLNPMHCRWLSSIQAVTITSTSGKHAFLPPPSSLFLLWHQVQVIFLQPPLSHMLLIHTEMTGCSSVGVHLSILLQLSA